MTTFLASILLMTGVICLSGARIGLLDSTRYTQYGLGASSMKMWGFVMLMAGAFLCAWAGVLFTQ